MLLEWNELQWGDTLCSITEYCKVHLLLEKDFSKQTFQKTTYMHKCDQSYRQDCRKDSGTWFSEEIEVRKAAENEGTILYCGVTL